MDQKTIKKMKLKKGDKVRDKMHPKYKGVIVEVDDKSFLTYNVKIKGIGGLVEYHKGELVKLK